MKKISVSLLLILGTFLFLPTVFAQDTLEVEIINDDWEAEFRNHLTFNLHAESKTDVSELFLFYKIVGQLATSRNEVEFTLGTTIEANFELDQTQPVNYMPSGAEVEYWWKLVDNAGNEFKTERQRVLYLDNRHEWENLSNDRLTLYWYEGGADFGQQLFDRANQALDTLETDVGIQLKEPIRVFIYANHNDLLDAISTGAQEWTGGVAYTEFSVVAMGVSPPQLDWGLRATTHEMTHLVIHQATDNPYGDLPRWLNEGIAVYNENKDELVEDFRPLVEKAIADDRLMTLRTLSSPFPSDPVQANLAYGQSGTMVKFIIDTYGTDAMAHLLEIFSEGALYDEALEEALGVNTDQLYDAWRESVGLSRLMASASTETDQTTDPVESTEVERQDETVETKPDNEVAPIPTETSTPASVVEPEDNGLASRLPCLAGIIPFFMIVVVGSAKTNLKAVPEK
ncbi:peptidase MA family metallohydrolase [Anaerolineales bacterium HSG25]|nr:peptidase MA family metallohydrolase [Anaerolineales bacterium HSG25]